MNIKCSICGGWEFKEKRSGELVCIKCQAVFEVYTSKDSYNSAPSHCMACGGNYPECMSGCKLYNNTTKFSFTLIIYKIWIRVIRGYEIVCVPGF